MKLRSGSIRKSATLLALIATAASAHAIPIAGQGTWETTLQSRDINSDGVVDAYYDTTLDVTWLADANYSLTSGRYPRENGRDYPFQSQEWLANLDYYGVTGWRLPVAGNADGGHLCTGLVCTFEPPPGDSELAHLYYVTLGNTYRQTEPLNTGSFLNVQTDRPYATSGTYKHPDLPPLGYPRAQEFSFARGDKIIYAESFPNYAWGLRDGDISIAAPVPEPETYAMLLLGLAGLGAYARKRGVRKVIE